MYNVQDEFLWDDPDQDQDHLDHSASSNQAPTKHFKIFFRKHHLNIDVLKSFFSLKLTSKETLFLRNFDSCLVNADWLIT